MHKTLAIFCVLAGCTLSGDGLAGRKAEPSAAVPVPVRSVVIPGTRTKRFPAGEFQIPCALIIGQRKESTDKKTSLNAALRDFNVAV